MTAARKKVTPCEIGPICPTCETVARLTNGVEIYPHRLDLAAKAFWKCDICGGYCGCHPGTTRSLGTPANSELRRARSLLHDRMIDPIWKTADRGGEYQPKDERARVVIRRAARGRVYAFLADRIGLTSEQCHTGMFDLETCRLAWLALQGVSYLEIRAWAHGRRKDAE